MEVQIITKEDLEQFGEKLFQDIKGLLGKRSEEPKKYLKSYQVKNMLKISGGTLQTLRSNGTIKFTRIGHIIYYNYDDIMKLFDINAKKGKR